MSVTPEPEHLSNRHRTTLRRIFEHPVSHNIEWREVVSLLDAVATTVEQHGGKLDVTIGTQKEFIEQPRGKDIDEQTVLDLRRMLSSALRPGPHLGGRGGRVSRGYARAPWR